MSKLFKFFLFFCLFLFFGFIVLGFIMYAVYYLYTNYKKEIISTFKKYPEIETVLRKIASFTSIELQEDNMSNLRTEEAAQTYIVPRRSRNISTTNSRKSQILKLLAENEKMEMSDIKNNFPKINVRTLRRDLSELEIKELITKSGRTKGASYSLR